MPVSQFHSFKNRDALAKSLAEVVTLRLTPDIEIGKFASIALSGGSTPKLFLSKLGELLGATKEMSYFAMVDERFVPPTDARSNEKMIRNTLGLTSHPASEFLSLYRENTTLEEATIFAEQKLREDEELPFDVVTLGMGLDGHTASFFPGAKNLAAATDPKTTKLFEPITAPGAQEPRITMTLPTLASAEFIVLHIEGNEKRAIFEQALCDGDADDLPIRHVLRHPDAAVEVYWAP